VCDSEALSGHQFIKLQVPDEASRAEVPEAQLPPDWSRQASVTRGWGDRWLREGRSAMLFVRSALVPETYNVLINPAHADAMPIQRIAVFPYPLDRRLHP
jgi:RES domain-containing protein